MRAGSKRSPTQPGTSAKGRERESPIQSVERAARLLALFSVAEPELSLGDLTARMGMSKATVHRYATALRRAGLLRLSAGRYTLGPRIVELSSAALAGLGVIKLAGPYLQALVAATSQTAVLSVWDGEAPVVVRVDENTDQLVRVVVSTGSRLPLESAQGRVFQAFAPDARGAAAERVRTAGLALNNEVVEGIGALAAPVFQGSEVVATIALVGTTAAINPETSVRMGGVLRDTAASLSAELGFVLSDETPSGGPGL